MASVSHQALLMVSTGHVGIDGWQFPLSVVRDTPRRPVSMFNADGAWLAALAFAASGVRGVQWQQPLSVPAQLTRATFTFNADGAWLAAIRPATPATPTSVTWQQPLSVPALLGRSRRLRVHHEFGWNAVAPPIQGFAPAVGFGPSHNVNDITTINFGASAFANTAPTGFGNWPGSPTTLDSGSSLLNASLSGGNLTATSTSSTTGGARNVSYQSTGLYYFEVTFTTIVAGCQSCCGIIASAATYVNFTTDGTLSTAVIANTGTVFSNNGNSGKSIGAIVSGDIIGVAINMTTRRGWFRKNGGNWNGNATFDPVTAVGGVTIANT